MQQGFRAGGVSMSAVIVVPEPHARHNDQPPQAERPAMVRRIIHNQQVVAPPKVLIVQIALSFSWIGHPVGTRPGKEGDFLMLFRHHRFR